MTHCKWSFPPPPHLSIEIMTSEKNYREEMEEKNSAVSKWKHAYCVLDLTSCVSITCIHICSFVTLVHLDNEASDFHSAVTSIFLTSEQEDTLNINYLPFFPGTKYCSVLLVCPEVSVYLMAVSYIVHHNIYLFCKCFRSFLFIFFLHS